MKIRNKIKFFLLNHPYVNPYRFTKERFIRNLTKNKRLFPDFLIIGYHKAGTTSLYDYLVQFENIGSAQKKEVQFFALSYWRGLQWYRTFFPTNLTKKKIEMKTNEKFITGEASPYYIFHPLSLERIHKTLPDIKLILLLRNPIDRAYSHYMHQRRLKKENVNTFEKVIEKDEERFEVMYKMFKEDKIREYNQEKYGIPYISIGKYVRDVKKLLELFPADQILILKSDEFEQSPLNVIKDVLEFLGITSKEKIDLRKKNIGKYNEMNINTRKKLIDYYKPYNQELQKILNMNLNWDK